MKTALMIAYYFPPLGGSGVQRSAKFVKYLPHEGWRPVVLTVRPNRRNSTEQGLDHGLLSDISDEVEVIRSRSAEFAAIYALLYRLGLKGALLELERRIPFLSQSYRIGWYPFAVRAGRRQLRSSPVDVIYTTSAPFVAHLIGRALSREYGIPWVADFRDPWTQQTYKRSAAPFQDSLDRRLETNVMESADAVIANTPANKRAICRDSHVSADKVHVIPNGYDPQDFECLEANGADNERFVISCTGTYYEMPDPEAFFRAYRGLRQEYPNAYLRFFGYRSRRVREACSRLLEARSWEASERVKHTEAISIMRRSAVLLANVPLMTDAHWVPGKIYEYLAARRPILLIGPQGDAATILQRARAGLTVANEEGAILAALRKLYSSWHAGRSLSPNLHVVHEYDRRRQTRNLAGIFEDVGRTRRVPASIDAVEIPL